MQVFMHLCSQVWLSEIATEELQLLSTLLCVCVSVSVVYVHVFAYVTVHMCVCADVRVDQRTTSGSFPQEAIHHLGFLRQSLT